MFFKGKPGLRYVTIFVVVFIAAIFFEYLHGNEMNFISALVISGIVIFFTVATSKGIQSNNKKSESFF